MLREDRHDIERNVISGLSDLIKTHLRAAAEQQYNPCSDPDRMDAEIADGLEKATRLRRLREEFENIITGVLDQPSVHVASMAPFLEASPFCSAPDPEV